MPGSRGSAPLSRATPHPAVSPSACRRSSSQRSWASGSQPQPAHLRWGECGRVAGTRRARLAAGGRPAAYPSRGPRRAACRGAGRSRAAAAGAGGADRAASAASRDVRRLPRPPANIAAASASRYVSRARRGVERLEAPGGVEQRGGRRCARRPNAISRAQSRQLGPLELVERAGSAVASRRARVGGARPRLACAAARARRPPRRVGRQLGRALQERRRGRQPPRACARSAERSSSAATSSSGPIVACARCQARRSGSPPDRSPRPAPDAPFAARRRRRAIDRRAHQRMTEADLRTDSTSRLPRPARRVAPTPSPRRRARAASRRRPARRRRSAAGAASPRAARDRRRSCPRSGRSGSRRAAKPPASSAAHQARGSSSSASGLPRLRRRFGRARAGRADPGSPKRAAACVRVAQPLQQPPGGPLKPAGRSARAWRTPTRPIPPAAGARRTPNLRGRLVEPLRVVDQAEQRRSSATAKQAEHRQADEERSGARRSAARRRRQRVPLRAAAGVHRSSSGAHSWCRPANASSISDSAPATRTTRHPAACSARSRATRLADARFAAQDENAALVRAHAPSSWSNTSRSLVRSRNPDAGQAVMSGDNASRPTVGAATGGDSPTASERSDGDGAPVWIRRHSRSAATWSRSQP